MSDKPSTPAARCAVLTIHDPKAPDALDGIADAVVSQLEKGGLPIARRWSVPADPGRVDDALIDFGRDAGADALVTVGATGLGRRDCALEVVARRCTKTIDAFASTFHRLAYALEWPDGPSLLTLRVLAGIASGKPVFALPGDEKACRIAVAGLILPELPRILAATRAP